MGNTYNTDTISLQAIQTVLKVHIIQCMLAQICNFPEFYFSDTKQSIMNQAVQKMITI